ncbi:MAG TPA: hypothetical protein VGJ07_24250 [Rugosimonospora sp.]
MLPGDLGAARGWWLLLRFNAGTVAFAAVVVALIALGWSDIGLPAEAVLGAASAAVWWVVARFVPAGAPVTARRQPQMHALVVEVAARMGLPAPDRIWLGHEAAVSGRMGAGRRELVLGLPAAYALSRPELTALVEHELAVLASERPSLAIRLYRRWAESMDDIAVLDDGKRPSRRDAAVAQALGAFAGAVERRADGGLTDAHVAARAFIRHARIDDDYELFRILRHDELRKRVGLRRYRIEDLHDGWRRRAVAGADLPAWDVDPDEATAVGRRHPGLRAAAKDLVGQPLDFMPAPDAVPLSPLTSRERRRLATKASPDARRDSSRRWRTFEAAPAQVWRRAAARDARSLLDAVAGVLGHEPHTRVEAAEVLRTRPVEVARADGHPDSDDLDIGRLQAVGWLDLLEDALLGQGWVRADPAVPGVLRGPDGAPLNGPELGRRAVTDPFAYAELLRLLAEPS